LCFIKVNVLAPSSVYYLLPPHIILVFRVFVYSLLQRCMFKV